MELSASRPSFFSSLTRVARSGRVSVYSFSASTPIWWSGIETKITRARNLSVWQVPADQSQALASLAQRTMQLQLTVQDGAVWIGNGERSVDVVPLALYGGKA